MFLFLLLFQLSVSASEPLKVAVFDTGLDLKDKRFENVLCKTGHTDFTGEGLEDTHGHGTFVAGLIKKNAKKSNYCMVIFKVFNKTGSGNYFPRALYTSLSMNIKVGNYSGGGYAFSEAELYLLRDNKDFTLFTSAGNENKNIDEIDNAYYPAFLAHYLKNVLVVGALDKSGSKLNSSNFGNIVRIWEQGRVSSTLPGGENGFMEGTSMATAITTGKYVFTKTH